MNSSALAQVDVELFADDGDTPVSRTVTDAAGEFRFEDIVLGPLYRLAIAAEGFDEERFGSISLDREAAVTLEPIRLVSNDNAGVGSLAGNVTDAVDGSPAAGAMLTFREGINVRSGPFIEQVVTDGDGNYTVSELPFGNVTLEIGGDGLQTVFFTFQVLGNITLDEQNATVSPRVDVGETRIVLTWGDEPSDLDAHLTGPGVAGDEPFHVYFNDSTDEGVELDVDDVSSYGPETITFDASRSGVYRYTVDRYSPGTPETLSLSRARVQVLRAEGVIAEFFVPAGEGDLWTVFDLQDGQIVGVNTITEREGTDDWFAPATRALR